MTTPLLYLQFIVMNRITEQKSIFNRVAEITGKDVDLIKAVVNHMWSETRANVITPKTWTTMVNNFGTFQPKEKKINYLLGEFEKGNTPRENKIEEFKRILSLKNKTK